MKVVLAQRQVVGGKPYGPGEVEVSDSVHATLKRRGALDHPLADYPQLIAAGYKTLEEARYMSDEVLLKIDGIGPATIRKIRGEDMADEAPPAPKFIGEKKSGA